MTCKMSRLLAVLILSCAALSAAAGQQPRTRVVMLGTGTPVDLDILR
jgi:hypothetical protein